MPQIDIRVPDLGSFKDVAVIELLVAPGDTLEVDTPIATLETDKATMDVPSSAAGTVVALHLSRGMKMNSGDLVATIETGAGVAAVSAPPAVAAVTSPSAPPAPAPAPAAAAPPAVGADVRRDLAPIEGSGSSDAHAGPSVRRLARELGVDLSRVPGSGIKGRISHEDVKAWVKRALSGALAPVTPALPKLPVVDHASFGPVETRPLTRVQRISGPRLQASWINIPHVTQFDEADITDLEALRQALKSEAAAQGVKLTPLAFVVAACVRALQEFPGFNASLDESGQNLVFKKYFNLGFAADTPQGLMVPVIRDADRKDIYAIARDLAALSSVPASASSRQPTCKAGASRCRVSAVSVVLRSRPSSIRRRSRSSAYRAR